MTKLEFIARQFAKTEKKRFEHYVVTRIWHLLKDNDIKIITQQHVTRPEGRALTDMYFPQFGIHIEVDEPHHHNRVDLDRLRDADIVNATSHTVFRIDVTGGIDEVNKEIDAVVNVMIARRKSADFIPWNLEEEESPQTYIDRGYIDLADNVAFRRNVDAANCFGLNYSGLQRGRATHPVEANTMIWFPKLYVNKDWINSISPDETVIQSRHVSDDRVGYYVDRDINGGVHTRICFARVRGPLGDVMYRFKGKYQIDINASNHETGLLLRRIATRVPTYPNG